MADVGPVGQAFETGLVGIDQYLVAGPDFVGTAVGEARWPLISVKVLATAESDVAELRTAAAKAAAGQKWGEQLDFPPGVVAGPRGMYGSAQRRIEGDVRAEGLAIAKVTIRGLSLAAVRKRSVGFIAAVDQLSIGSTGTEIA